jgi:hypothetical protein
MVLVWNSQLEMIPDSQYMLLLIRVSDRGFPQGPVDLVFSYNYMFVHQAL